MKIKFGTIVKVFSAIIFLLFCLEHYCRTHNYENKPSTYIWKVTNFSDYCWEQIGRFIAYISSFYTYLPELKGLLITLQELWDPIYELVKSPMHVVYGYCEVAVEYKYPILITFGSITLFILVCYIVWRYRKLSMQLLSKILSFKNMFKRTPIPMPEAVN
jgi:hypothetical protein